MKKKFFKATAAVMTATMLLSSVASAAAHGYVDLVIDPADTRKYLVAAFEMLYTKYEYKPDKKHGTK